MIITIIPIIINNHNDPNNRHYNHRHTDNHRRYRQIVATGERYKSCEDDHEELPPIFWWFPKQVVTLTSRISI